MRRTRRKFSYKELFIALSTSFLVFAVAIPSFINYLYEPKDKISFQLKENIAIAGKNYFEQEKDKNYVTLEELIRKGYIIDKEALVKNNCDIRFSSVELKKVNNKKYNYVVDLYCGSDFSVLTLSN